MIITPIALILIGIALLLGGIKLKNKEMVEVAPYVILTGLVLIAPPLPG